MSGDVEAGVKSAGWWAGPAGSSNRSRRDPIDTDAGSCALYIANIMRCVLLLSVSIFLPGINGDLLRDSVHVTSAAARPNNELWCYKCLAEVPEDKCADLRHNNSALIHKCQNDRRMCMVKRFSFTTSTENSTTALKMWALERNCTKHCEPGCIVIGERTKLYACTSCCTTSLCNYGSDAIRIFLNTNQFHIMAIIYCFTIFNHIE